MTLRRFLRVLLVLFFTALLAVAGFTWWAGDELASPGRRPLHDYHREFLADPASHGVGLEKFTLADGTPCLMTVPEPTGKLGTRGVKIRQQMQERGQTLAAPGQVIGTLVLAHGRKGRKITCSSRNGCAQWAFAACCQTCQRMAIIRRSSSITACARPVCPSGC